MPELYTYAPRTCRTTERGDTSVGERAAHDLWPQYRGLASDEVQIEIYERWLEPIEEAKQ